MVYCIELVFAIDKENLSKLIVGFIKETLRVGKSSMGLQPFIKFIKRFHCQTFTLSSTGLLSSQSSMYVNITHSYQDSKQYCHYCFYTRGSIDDVYMVKASG